MGKHYFVIVSAPDTPYSVSGIYADRDLAFKQVYEMNGYGEVRSANWEMNQTFPRIADMQYEKLHASNEIES